jgi:hypothetical protein
MALFDNGTMKYQPEKEEIPETAIYHSDDNTRPEGLV